MMLPHVCPDFDNYSAALIKWPFKKFLHLITTIAKALVNNVFKLLFNINSIFFDTASNNRNYYIRSNHYTFFVLVFGFCSCAFRILQGVLCFFNCLSLFGKHVFILPKMLQLEFKEVYNVLPVLRTLCFFSKPIKYFLCDYSYIEKQKE